MALLEVKNLSIAFGGLKAVDNFQISIDKGQLYGLIGPNGAGKTTVFNLLTGVYKPDAGSIELNGINVTGRKTTEINQSGIARTFQNIRLFKTCPCWIMLRRDFTTSTDIPRQQVFSGFPSTIRRRRRWMRRPWSF